MLGAIIGDMAGTPFEYLEFQDSRKGNVNLERRRSILNLDKKLITKESFFSDDTILTIAIAEAILEKKEYFETLKKYGKEYGEKINKRKNFFRSSFSPTFIKWAKTQEDICGTSIGNGSAMRVSPIAFLNNELQKVQAEARKSAIPSHNSKEAIEGAECLATVIFLARQKVSKDEIKEYVVNKYGYCLNFDLEKLQQTNYFQGTCNITVSQSIFIFLISNNFEDAIRKAISIGGDTDTIACMTGAIAEAYYGIPNILKDEVLSLLPDYMKDILQKAYAKIEENKI